MVFFPEPHLLGRRELPNQPPLAIWSHLREIKTRLLRSTGEVHSSGSQAHQKTKIDQLDVDSLFSNIESVHQISAKLLSLLEEATTDVEPAMQVIGMFILFLSSPIRQEIIF